MKEFMSRVKEGVQHHAGHTPSRWLLRLVLGSPRERFLLSKLPKSFKKPYKWLKNDHIRDMKKILFKCWLWFVEVSIFAIGVTLFEFGLGINPDFPHKFCVVFGLWFVHIGLSSQITKDNEKTQNYLSVMQSPRQAPSRRV